MKKVNNFQDIKVKRVNNFPNSCGKWQFVDNFEDFKIKFVDNFEDFTIKFVDNDNQDQIRPSKVTINLKNGSTTVDSKEFNRNYMMNAKMLYLVFCVKKQEIIKNKRFDFVGFI